MCMRGYMWWSVDMIDQSFRLDISTPTTSPGPIPAPTDPPTLKPSTSFIPSTKIVEPICPIDFTGHLPFLFCTHYFSCVSGIFQLLYECPEGTLWSVPRQYCDWIANVVCDDKSSAPQISPTLAPQALPTTTEEPTSPPTQEDVCAIGTNKNCGMIGCVWKKKCQTCPSLNKKGKKKCTNAGCNWVDGADDECQSCNIGGNKAECNEMSCVWANVKNIGKMCTPCAAITKGSKCKKVGCVFKKKKCYSCSTLTKSKCKKENKCAWDQDTEQCYMDGSLAMQRKV